MATITPNQIGFVSGNPTTTSVKVVAASFTSGNVTVTAYTNPDRSTGQVGSPITITMSAYCTDRGSNDPAGVQRVGYVGSGTLTGLSAGTRYYLKLQQGAVTETNASTCTAPAAGADCRIWFLSCDQTYAIEGPYGVEVGACDYIADYIEANPTIPQFIVFDDDLGYADRHNTNAALGIDDTGFSGKNQSGRPYQTHKAYDFGCVYFCWLGMMGNTSNPSVHWGLDDRRNYMVRNVPWMFMWGDHDFENDIGQGTAETAQENLNYAPGREAWMGLMGLLLPTPDIRSRDTTSTHWAITLGDARIVCMDSVTQSTGGYYSAFYPTGPYPALPYVFDAQYGNDQIDDVLDAMDTAQPFKFLVFPNAGERAFFDMSAHGTTWPFCGAQYPLADYQPAEWNRLFFAQGNTPQSLMENPNTNGTDGVMIRLNGDIHLPMVQQHTGFADGNKGTGLRAQWTTWYHAPVTGQNNVTVSQTAMDNIGSRYYDGVELLYHNFRKVAEAYDSTNKKRYATAFADVYGSLSPKRVKMSLMVGDPEWTAAGHADAVRYTREFRVGSNLPVGGDEMAPVKSSVALRRLFRAGPHR